MSKFTIIEELNSKQADQLFELFQQMWWAKDRTKEEIALVLKNSISFGVIENHTQNLVAYARVLTDGIKAFIFDVMAVEYHRGKGLGKALMNKIMSHPKLKNVKNFELKCAPDMMAFYKKFGFSEHYDSELKPMRLSRVNKN